MQEPKKIIIVGGNAAGPAAAAKAKRVNPNADVILFEAGNFISTGTCELPYLFSGEIDDYNKIVNFTPDTFLAKKGVRVFTNHFVKSINSKNKEIEVIDRKTSHIKQFNYDKLILTTGSSAKELPDLPFSLENVFSLKSVHDYIKIKDFIKGNEIEKVLVIGSGYIGLEIADSLKKAGYNVSILEKENLPFPHGDKEVQFLINDLLVQNNIKFLSASSNNGFITKNNRFTQLKHEGRFLDFDLAIVAVGVVPNISVAENAGLKIGNLGGISVDSRLKTSDPNIFAAGDNIEIKNYLTKQNDYIPLATYAHSYGHIAGENASGGNKIAEPVIPNSAFQVCGKFIAQVGLSEIQAKKYFVNSASVSAVANNKVKVMPNSQKVFGKIIFDRRLKIILGASFVGGNEVSGYTDIISVMIYNKIPVDNLISYNFNYTPPLSPFVNLLSILGRKIKEII
ncbi:MAG: FAD-dependent oxidoreductase [Ignavibacteriales bacterium]|nr:FAD-dependent oxidoreductase [Ignavibacteriales bacterium]